MATGRSHEARTLSVTTTSGVATITAAAGSFAPSDAGRGITAASGIPASTTILSVQSDTGATMSANASASGARTATLAENPGGLSNGYKGWSPETEAEAKAYTVVPVGTAPEILANNYTPKITQRARG